MDNQQTNPPTDANTQETPSRIDLVLHVDFPPSFHILHKETLLEVGLLMRLRQGMADIFEHWSFDEGRRGGVATLAGSTI